MIRAMPRPPRAWGRVPTARIKPLPTMRASRACVLGWCGNSCSPSPRRTKKASASPRRRSPISRRQARPSSIPAPGGALFRDAIASLLPAYDAPMLAAAYKELFPAGTASVSKAVEITGDPSGMPPELSLRILVERETPSSGEGLYVLDRYLRERGDKHIKSVADLIGNSTFYNHAPIDGVIPPPKTRLEELIARTERWTKKSDGSPYLRRVPVMSLDGNGWHVSRTLLQALV